MTQYDKIKNICYYTFVSGYILFVFFYFFNVPISGDYWNLKWGLTPIYDFFTRTSSHPGRNFGELLTMLTRAFANWLSFIPEPLYRIKFLNSLLDTVLLVSLAYVSSYIIGKKQKLSFLIFLFYFFYTSLTWTVVNVMAVLPMLYVSLLPTIFYLRDHTLPSWMKDDPYTTFGFWAVFCYMGSQVYDPVYFIGSAFFGMVLLYLTGLYFFSNSFEQKIKDKTSFYLTGSISIFYILLSFMAAFKNQSGRISVYESTVSFNILEILTRLNTQYNLPIKAPVVISIIIAIGIILYFIKNKKISGTGYIYIALTTSSVFSLMLITVLGSYHTNFVIWSSLIVVVAAICYLWTNVKWTKFFIPTMVFALFIQILLPLYSGGIWNDFVNNRDLEILYLLKEADNKNLTQVSLSKEEFVYFGLSEWGATQVPPFARMLGYTKKDISIVVTNK